MSKIIRFIIHIPHGFISGLFIPFSACAGITYAIFFMFYQYIEDWRIKDHSYLDCRGWMLGYPLGFILGLYLKVLLKGKL